MPIDAKLKDYILDDVRAEQPTEAVVFRVASLTMSDKWRDALMSLPAVDEEGEKGGVPVRTMFAILCSECLRFLVDYDQMSHHGADKFEIGEWVQWFLERNGATWFSEVECVDLAENLMVRSFMNEGKQVRSGRTVNTAVEPAAAPPLVSETKGRFSATLEAMDYKFRMRGYDQAYGFEFKVAETLFMLQVKNGDWVGAIDAGRKMQRIIDMLEARLSKIRDEGLRIGKADELRSVLSSNESDMELVCGNRDLSRALDLIADGQAETAFERRGNDRLDADKLRQLQKLKAIANDVSMHRRSLFSLKVDAERSLEKQLWNAMTSISVYRTVNIDNILSKCLTEPGALMAVYNALVSSMSCPAGRPPESVDGSLLRAASMPPVIGWRSFFTGFEPDVGTDDTRIVFSGEVSEVADDDANRLDELTGTVVEGLLSRLSASSPGADGIRRIGLGEWTEDVPEKTMASFVASGALRAALHELHMCGPVDLEKGSGDMYSSWASSHPEAQLDVRCVWIDEVDGADIEIGELTISSSEVCGC